MRKYILAGSALLITCVIFAQQETTLLSKESGTVKHPMVRIPAAPVLRYKIPSTGPLVVSLEGKQLLHAQSKRSALWGSWQSWYPNGQSCDSGKLVQNIPDGEWKVWNEAGQLIALRHYNAEKYRKITEEIRLNHPRRSFYQLTALAKENRNLAIHYLSAAYSFPLGLNHKYHSIDELVRANTHGSSYQPVFAAGLHDGLYINFFTNGQTRDSGVYKDGLRSGHWVHRDQPGGFIYSGSYQQGVKNQQWKVYHPDGRLSELIEYRRGEIIWRKQYHP